MPGYYNTFKSRFLSLDLVFSFTLQAAYNSNPNDEDAMRAIDLMYDAALVSSGFTVSPTLH